MLKPRYRKFGTTADVGVEAIGADLKESFAQQAVGMFSVMTDLRKVRPVHGFEVQAEGVDFEELLVDWLNELLYLRDSKGVLLRRFEIHDLDDHRLSATVYGEAMDEERHVRKTEVKAITYHLLMVQVTKAGVWTRVVYDI